MITTIDLPETLVSEAMQVTQLNETQLFITALENLIQHKKIKEIKNYAGKVNLEIDISEMRKR